MNTKYSKFILAGLLALALISLFSIFKNEKKEIKEAVKPSGMKKLFIIHQFCKSQPWAPAVDKGIREEVRRFENLEIESIYCEDHHSSKDFILDKVKELSPWAVVIDDDTIAELVGESLLESENKVFFANLYRDFDDLGLIKKHREKATAVLQNPRIFDAIQIVEKLINKKVLNISIVGGDGLSARLLALNMEREIAKLAPNIKYKSKFAKRYEVWKNIISQEAKTADILISLLPFHVVDESTGQIVNWKKAGDFLKSNTKIPTIGITSCSGGFDRLMSYSVDPYIVGKQVGHQVRRVILGELIKDVKIEKFYSHSLELNRGEIKRLDLTVPEDLVQFVRY